MTLQFPILPAISMKSTELIENSKLRAHSIKNKQKLTKIISRISLINLIEGFW